MSKTFDVGLPAKRGKTGKTQMTFFERLKESEGSHGGADLEKVQDMNWSLPRLSVSGRETIGVLDKDPDVLIRGLDGIRDTDGVIVIGTTNRREYLPSALLRAGRLELEMEMAYQKF